MTARDNNQPDFSCRGLIYQTLSFVIENIKNEREVQVRFFFSKLVEIYAVLIDTVFFKEQGTEMKHCGRAAHISFVV
jgi:hypothetical protein